MRKARKYALDILYSAELTSMGVDSAMATYATMSSHEIPAYSRELAHGVVAHLRQIDRELESSLSTGWAIERMPIVDRVLARIAIFEMTCADVPPAVAISEAVSLARELSTDSSPSFLTGVLSHVATEVADFSSVRPPSGDSDRSEPAPTNSETTDNSTTVTMSTVS
jgi:N utilization substance protein B